MTKNLNYISDISLYKTTTDAEDASALFFNKLIWGIDEVCSFTRYSKGTIYNLVSEGDIPYRNKRGRLWFVPNEILKWIKGELP